MTHIQINGVGFNADSVLKMTKQEFLDWNFLKGCWLHLKKSDRDEAIEEAWTVINEVHKAIGQRDVGNYKTELNIGNDHGNTDEANTTVKGTAADSDRKRNRNKREISKPSGRAGGNGTKQGPNADNA